MHRNLRRRLLLPGVAAATALLATIVPAVPVHASPPPPGKQAQTAYDDLQIAQSYYDDDTYIAQAPAMFQAILKRYPGSSEAATAASYVARFEKSLILLHLEKRGEAKKEWGKMTKTKSGRSVDGDPYVYVNYPFSIPELAQALSDYLTEKIPRRATGFGHPVRRHQQDVAMAKPGGDDPIALALPPRFGCHPCGGTSAGSARARVW